MNVAKKKLATLIVALGLVATATLKFGSFGRSPGDGTVDLDEAVEKIQRAQGTMMPTDQAIQFFRQRVEQDPSDFMSLTYVAEHQLRLARETGDVSHYAEAETAARRAIKIHQKYSPAMSQLAAACVAQHKFQDAFDWAQKAFELDARNYAALLVAGDALMGLGKYSEAERTYEELRRIDPEPAVLARVAHLLELRGNYDESLKYVQAAANVMLQQQEPKEEVAWYQALLGDLYFETGRLDNATRHFEAALRILTDYHVALIGLGKVQAARGDLAAAIESLRRAAEVNPQISTLAALADLHVRRGDRATAQLCFDRIEVLAGQAGGRSDLFRRDLTLFYADHELNLTEALELAQADFAVRQDIFAHDTLAWALYKNSRVPEAVAAMEQALRLGSRHPTLCYHAGMIYYGSGDNEKARNYLKRAVAMNPQFSIRYADEARRTLAKLGEKVGGDTVVDLTPDAARWRN